MAIGDQSPSRRIIQSAATRFQPQDFNKGVGTALRNFGNTVGQAALIASNTADANQAVELAYKQRQERLQMADMQATFIELDNSMTRELSERYTDASNDSLRLEGFTDATDAWADELYAEFLASMPEDLRPRFAATIETAKQAKLNSAFQLQVGAENAYFTNQVGDMVTLAREELLSTPILDEAELDELEMRWLENLEGMLEASPLAGPETAELAEQLMQDISMAKMVRIVQEEALNNIQAVGSLPGSIERRGSADHAKNPVAAALSAPAVGLLNVIAGVESGGDYNALFSPTGKRYFTDYSKHPNSPATIAHGEHVGKSSTAAGRYQFINGTWNTVASELGLEDFSPENQDRAAWHLARKDYQARTGRDLEAVLMSGNQPAIIAAKRILEDTWEGLKNVEDDDFVDEIAGATGNPSSTLFDEQFAHIPLDTRQAIMFDGLAKANAVRTEMAAQYEKERSGAIENLNRQLFEGSAGLREIQGLQEQYRLSVQEQSALTRVYEEKNAQQIAAGQLLNSLGDPAYQFDPTKESHRNQADALFTEAEVGKHISEGDIDFVENVLVPIMTHIGYIPDATATQLSGLINSKDPQQAVFALDALTGIANEAPNAFSRAFNDDVVNQVMLFKHGRAVLPQDELLSAINRVNDPAFDQQRKVVNDMISEVVKDNPDVFSPLGIARRLGADRGLDPINGPALSVEYDTLYRYFLGRTQNTRAAQNAADEIIAQRWGPMEIGGVTRVMRYPPTKEHPTFKGSHAYIEQQLREDLSLMPDDPVELVSDHMTDHERNVRGVPPSYTIVRRDVYGTPQVVRNRDVAGFADLPKETQDAIGNLPARFTPQITEDMKSELADLHRRLTEIEIEDEEAKKRAPTNMKEVEEAQAAQEERARKRQKLLFDLDIPDMGQTGRPLFGADF